LKVINHIKTEEGNYLFGVEATEKEIGMMINIALAFLVKLGEVPEEDFDKPSFEVDLNEIPMEQFYKA
jgi:hypothetical protein